MYTDIIKGPYLIYGNRTETSPRYIAIMYVVQKVPKLRMTREAGRKPNPGPQHLILYPDST